MDYKLRPATTQDYAFLYELHKTTMKPCVEQVWGWNEEFQQAYFQDNFGLDNLLIIVVSRENVGMMHYEEFPERLFLSTIEMLPAFQGKGIGTHVIHSFIKQAHAAHK